jgi:hypothetical protein
MSDIINQCGGGSADLTEILNSMLVIRTSDGQVGLRAVVTNVASGDIESYRSCSGVNLEPDKVVNEILTNDTIDGRIAIQFFNVTS